MQLLMHLHMPRNLAAGGHRIVDTISEVPNVRQHITKAKRVHLFKDSFDLY
jgi:hypothetical protein